LHAIWHDWPEGSMSVPLGQFPLAALPDTVMPDPTHALRVGAAVPGHVLTAQFQLAAVHAVVSVGPTQVPAVQVLVVSHQPQPLVPEQSAQLVALHGVATGVAGGGPEHVVPLHVHVPQLPPVGPR